MSTSAFSLRVMDYATNRHNKRKEFNENGGRIRLENKKGLGLYIEVYEENEKSTIIIHKVNNITGEYKRIYSGDFWNVPISTVQEERRNPHREHEEEEEEEETIPEAEYDLDPPEESASFAQQGLMPAQNPGPGLDFASFVTEQQVQARLAIRVDVEEF